MHISILIVKEWMGKIGAVNIANSSRIIHCQLRAKNRGKVLLFTLHNSRMLNDSRYLGRIVCRLQALAMGDTGLAKC